MTLNVRMSSTFLPTLLVLYAFLNTVASVIVSTNYGQIEGIVASYPNASAPFKSVSKFLGVPFAAPPLGELRFKEPKPPKEWKPKIRPAKTSAAFCLQNTGYDAIFKPYAQNFSFSEDCLYLDIYTPNVSSNLPVMVYIHGGGFQGGSSVLAPSDILALQGVVVVAIQYRLAALGFFTTGDSVAPGNYGMLDQVEALKWVKENIRHFGGDSGKVTIFGTSAGGNSVGLHLMSPLSKGLFHQGILESGTELGPISIQPISLGLQYAKELATNLECPTNDNNEMVSCIRKKEGAVVERASQKTTFRWVDYIQWGPVVDRNFLPDTPRNLRKSGEFNKVPLIVGYTSHEGSLFLGTIAQMSLGISGSMVNGTSLEFFKSFVTKYAQARNSRKENAKLIADALEFMYTPWPDNNDEYALRSQLVDLVGDYVFVAPSFETAEMHSTFAPVHVYEFTHRSKLSLFPEWMGVVHGENLVYELGIPMLAGIPLTFDATDRNVSRLFMGVYADFARSATLKVGGVTWEKFNSSHRAYLQLDANPKMAGSYHPHRMAFWNNYYPKLSQVKFEIKTVVASGTSSTATMATLVHVIIAIILATLWLQLYNPTVVRVLYS